MSRDNGHIPFVDLISPHSELEEELIAVFRNALRSGTFVGGPMVEEFEHDFAKLCGTAHCVGVGSGTDALRFALIAAGVKRGDHVLTVPNTFIATTEAITQAGAVPDFVDVDEQTYNINPEMVREYLESQCDLDDHTGKPLNRRTGRPITAIVPVHLYGQMADMDPILELAERYRLAVVEDACQAHGAGYHSKKYGRWMPAGSMGTAAAFSFYPGKNLGACGEAGAVTTNDLKIAHTVRLLRNHGQDKKYVHQIEGYNGRLDAIQAGILQIKLKYLSRWNEKRRQSAYRYNKALGLVDGITIPHEPSWAKAVYHLYIIRTRNRDELQKHLSQRHIRTGLHYPVPLHLQKPYERLGYHENDFPVSQKVAKDILSLPIYPQLQIEQQEHTIQEIINAVSKKIPTGHKDRT